MANTHSFPLIRLPSLARDHVFVLMNVREQYLFATLSKKSIRVAKSGVRRLSYSFEMMLVYDEASISIRKDGTDDSFELLISRRSTVNRILNRICLKVESIKEVSTELLPFLNDLFKISRFDLDFFSEDFEEFWASMKISKIEFNKLEVRGRDNKTFDWIMENCRDVKKLVNDYQTTDDFQWDSLKPFTFDYLSLCNAPWLTVDHMSRLFNDLKFFEVVRNEVPMTNDDLNQLVKNWIDNSKLEFFGVQVNTPINLNHILEDIQKEPVQRARVENCLRDFAPGNAFKIRQKSGKEAVVCIWLKSRFMINTHFYDSTCDFWAVEKEDDPYDIHNM
ncbi:unnamed protein product [Caenorhabditis brenneri]